jgi:peptide-methionine (R)-S-oxide reductase
MTMKGKTCLTTGTASGIGKETLSPEEYRLLWKEGTEPAFSGKYWNSKDEGIYTCAGCGNDLFSSDTKFDSGTGWPSFFRPVSPDAVEEKPDNRFGMRRTAIACGRCGGHLGHVFDDGPAPSGMRYCMNSGALHFKPGAKGKEE